MAKVLSNDKVFYYFIWQDFIKLLRDEGGKFLGAVRDKISSMREDI